MLIELCVAACLHHSVSNSGLYQRYIFTYLTSESTPFKVVSIVIMTAVSLIQ